MKEDSEGDYSDESCLSSFLRRLWLLIVSVLQEFICCSNIGEQYGLNNDAVREQFVKPEACVLVLGASDTGKSTFMRQMRLEFGDQYPIEERRSHQPHIRRNLLESMYKLVTAAHERNLSYETPQATEASMKFNKWHDIEAVLETSNMDISWTSSIEILWQDAAIQKAYSRRSEFHLITNADYFINNAARILLDDYAPTVEDILRMRFITRNAVTKTYELDNIRMTLNDMGGQRLEREHWIKQIDNPSAILFVASLSEYDQSVEEASEYKNRVQESLDIFDEMLGYAPFENTPVILLLNKSDIFNIKIKEQHLKSFFPGYNGVEGDALQARDYITTLYENLTRKHKRNLLVRYTEATNRDNFRAIFAFVSNYVSRTIIGIGGLY